MVAELRSPKSTHDGWQARMLFKKRMFRETDEAVSEPQFINLSYIQARRAADCAAPACSGAACQLPKAPRLPGGGPRMCLAPLPLHDPQAQHDYLAGNYPVVRDDAAQMAALQMQVRALGAEGLTPGANGCSGAGVHALARTACCATT